MSNVLKVSLQATIYSLDYRGWLASAQNDRKTYAWADPPSNLHAVCATALDPLGICERKIGVLRALGETCVDSHIF